MLLGNQIMDLTEFAEDRGYEIFKIYVDKISGSSDTRPALHRLIHDARIKQFKAVVIWKLDRLGRSLQHLIRIVEMLNKYNVDLISKERPAF